LRKSRKSTCSSLKKNKKSSMEAVTKMITDATEELKSKLDSRLPETTPNFISMRQEMLRK
jgi:hypothetical protein